MNDNPSDQPVVQAIQLVESLGSVAFGSVAGALLGGGIIYGRMQTKLEQLESKVSENKEAADEQFRDINDAMQTARSEFRDEIRALRSEIKQDLRETLRDTLILDLREALRGAVAPRTP